MTDHRIPPRRDAPPPPPPPPGVPFWNRRRDVDGTTAPPSNHLAAELRELQDEIEEGLIQIARERLAELVGRVEAVDELTATVTHELTATVTHELTAELSGLDPDQEIRARALECATAASRRYPGAEDQTLLDLAEAFAGWITTGRRP